MTKDELKRSFEDMGFACDRAQRYHAALAGRWSAFAVSCQILELAATSSVMLDLTSGFPNLQRIVMGLAALVAGLALATRSHRRVAWHKAKQARFAMLAGRLPADPSLGTAELLSELRAGREDIEKDDGPTLECLSMECHNAVCLARGWTHGLYPMTWWQRNVLTWLPVPYREPTGRQ